MRGHSMIYAVAAARDIERASVWVFSLAIAGRVLIGDQMAERHDCRETAFWSVSTYASLLYD